MASPPLARGYHQVAGFVARVLGDFRRNQGLLLGGAVAYYTLLSLVPLFALLLVALSHLVDQQRLIATVSANLDFLVPGHAADITRQVSTFLAHRHLIGVLGFAALLFFSAVAFTVLESAMALVFHHRERPCGRRHPLVSALIPYGFVMALGVGLLLVTVISGALEAVGRNSVHLWGHAWSLARLSRAMLHLLGMLGSTLMLAALYVVMPVGKVAFRRALLGAAAATVLWELVRHLLVWYFARLSMVNLIYGSLATAVMVLLTLEAAAVILLLGAQTIAELERRSSGPPEHARLATAVAAPDGHPFT